MSKAKSAARTRKQRRYRFFATVCKLCGSVILLAIVAISLPLSLPRFLGCDIYNVVSGSMEPAIPTGSIVYVTRKSPVEIEPGEVIAFSDSGRETVVIHRVVKNLTVSGAFVTKGDANPMEDIDQTSYNDVLGVVTFHAPVLGNISALYTSLLGKIYAFSFALVAFMFFVLGGQLRELSIPDGTQEEKRPQLSEVEALLKAQQKL